MKIIKASEIEGCECKPTVLEDALKAKDEMVKIMESNNGVGLAAPQVGIFERFFVMKNYRAPGYIMIINPEMEVSTPKMGTFEEGCLSYPGESYRVKRYKQIRAKWTTELGKVVYTKLSGKEAQIFQHELDHLDGRTTKMIAESH